MLKRVGKILKRIQEKESGFTLIELMIVIVIIGILVAVIAPNFFSSTTAAKRASNNANLKVLNSAVDRYYADVGEWPEQKSDLTDDNSLPGWNGPYATSDDFNNAPTGYDPYDIDTASPTHRVTNQPSSN